MLKRLDGAHQLVGVGEVFVQECQEQIATFGGIVGIHCHLAEEVFHLGVYHSESSKTVPEVVEGKNCFCTHLGRLVFKTDERATKLYGHREHIAQEVLREVKHVGGGNLRHAIGIEGNVVPKYEAVTADNLLLGRIPHYKLATGHRHHVKFVDVTFLACATTGSTEGNFAQTTKLAHSVRLIMRVDNVYFVVALVGFSQKTFGREFCNNQIRVNRFNDRFHE